MRYSDDTTWNRSRRLSLALSNAALTMALLVSVGCSNVRPLQVDAVATDIHRPLPVAKLPAPKPVSFLPVKWAVITPATLPPGNDWVAMCISPRMYENLSKNIADMLRWAQEAESQLDYYRRNLDNASQTD